MKKVTLLTFFRFGVKFNVCVLPQIPTDLTLIEMYDSNGSFCGEKYISKDMAEYLCNRYITLV